MAENEERGRPRQYGLCRSRFIEAEHRCISDGRARKRDEGNEAREENRRGRWRRGGGGIYQPLQLLNSSLFLKKTSLSLSLSLKTCYESIEIGDGRLMDLEFKRILNTHKKNRYIFLFSDC